MPVSMAKILTRHILIVRLTQGSQCLDEVLAILVHLASTWLPSPYPLTKAHYVLKGTDAILLAHARRMLFEDTSIPTAHRCALKLFNGDDLKHVLESYTICSEDYDEALTWETFKNYPFLTLPIMSKMLLEAYRLYLISIEDVEKTPAKFIEEVTKILPVRSPPSYM